MKRNPLKLLSPLGHAWECAKTNVPIADFPTLKCINCGFCIHICKSGQMTHINNPFWRIQKCNRHISFVSLCSCCPSKPLLTCSEQIIKDIIE
jgi:uncharacterized Fe-S center protein